MDDDDGQMPEYGYTISSPGQSGGWGELKIEIAERLQRSL